MLGYLPNGKRSTKKASAMVLPSGPREDLISAGVRQIDFDDAGHDPLSPTSPGSPGHAPFGV